MKTAIVVMSDPKTNSEEALGRLFNALATAYDFKHNGDEVTLLFQGAGTRWAGEVTKKEHPAHGLYKAVEDTVAGVSCGCADVFGASEAAQKNGFELIKGNAVPGTSGLPSLRALSAAGYNIMVF
ncbi:MAG TPA: DsrE family protein [Gammaproteobacteria bacterium]